LAAPGDLEFLERVGEVGLDGAQGDVQLLGDLLVGVPCCGQGCDSVLGRGERSGTGEQPAARPGACGCQLVPGAPGDQAQASALS